MRIDSIELKNFRNQDFLHIDLNSSINGIVGNNGAGKTSLLEAIHTISTTKSFKAKKEIDVIKDTSSFSTIQLIRSNGDAKSMKIIYERLSESRIKKTFLIEDVHKRATAFIGELFTVLFTTDLINGFTDKAVVRRKFFNQFLSQVDRDYLILLSTYEKVLKNKTKTLKIIREGGDPYLLEYWNKELISLSTEITIKRLAFITSLESFLLSHEMLERHIHLEYISKYANILSGNDAICDAITKDITTYRKFEIDAGKCLIGSHRDDYNVFFNTRDIKSFASRGEQKFSISLLLFAIAQYIYEQKETSPVILLDDLSAEMDIHNLHTILDAFIKTEYQIILTAIDKKLYETKCNSFVVLN